MKNISSESIKVLQDLGEIEIAIVREEVDDEGVLKIQFESGIKMNIFKFKGL